ncbi:MAG TPA: PAS domain S-box protein [Vicinamibacterales bacterium]|nr:PAS domain S-box protein [Vicinamibacterales bacterium]
MRREPDERGNVKAASLMSAQPTGRAGIAFTAIELAFQQVLDHAAEGIHWVGADGTILWANQTELDLLGYSESEYLGRHIAEFHLDGACIDDILARLTRGETLHQYPARLRHKDGSVRHVEINSNVLWEGDTFLRTQCFTRDVSAQRARDDAARRLAEIVENSEDAIISQDLHGTITSWNSAAERLYGFTRSEAVGQSIDLIIPADLRHEEERDIARIRSGERVPPFDTMRRHKSGAVLPVALTISPIRDAEGRIIGASKTARDIAERKRIEARDRFLLELDDAVRPLSEPDEITYTAAKALGTHLGVNRCAYATVEDDQDTFTVTGNFTNGVASIVGRYTFRQFGEECLRLMRAGEPYVVSDSATDGRLVDRDRAAYVQTAITGVICVPVMKQGRFVAAMAVHTDAPRQWQPEEVALVQRVANRCWESIERAKVTQSLRASEARLLEADRRKDEFLAMLAHELRNPLAPIRTGLQLIRLAGDTPAAVAQVRTMMERQLAHIVRLVDDLLDVSRITSGKIQLQREPVSLRQLIEDAVDVNRAAIEQAGVVLGIDLPAEECILHVDPTRTGQVISNVLNNAVKFTSAGGHVRISATVTPAQPADVVIKIVDDGVGIPAAVLPHVFDLFVQADGGTSRSHGGLGIGLALARTLIELHGGTIEAHSDGTGRGSTFFIRMPLTPAPAPSASATAPAPAHNTAPRVLVVDDNADSAEMLVMLVRTLGGEAHAAFDGESAVHAAADFRPQIVLLDIGLPGIDGYETCRRIRSQHGKDLKIVAITGWGQDQDKRRAIDAGFDTHLTKPADPLALERLLARETPSKAAASSRS